MLHYFPERDNFFLKQARKRDSQKPSKSNRRTDEYEDAERLSAEHGEERSRRKDGRSSKGQSLSRSHSRERFVYKVLTVFFLLLLFFPVYINWRCIWFSIFWLLGSITAEVRTNDDHVVEIGRKRRGLAQDQGRSTVITAEVVVRAGGFKNFFSLHAVINI